MEEQEQNPESIIEKILHNCPSRFSPTPDNIIGDKPHYCGLTTRVVSAAKGSGMAHVPCTINSCPQLYWKRVAIQFESTNG